MFYYLSFIKDNMEIFDINDYIVFNKDNMFWEFFFFYLFLKCKLKVLLYIL